MKTNKEKITLSTEINRNLNMKVVHLYIYIFLVIIHFNYFILKSSQLYSIIPTYM